MNSKILYCQRSENWVYATKGIRIMRNGIAARILDNDFLGTLYPGNVPHMTVLDDLKMFIPEHLRPHIKCEDDLDCVGLLLICHNNEMIHRKLSNPHSILEAIKCRNQIMHSGKYELSEGEAEKYIDVFIRVLQEKIFMNLKNDALWQLFQLRARKIMISTEDMTLALQDVERAIKTTIKERYDSGVPEETRAREFKRSITYLRELPLHFARLSDKLHKQACELADYGRNLSAEICAIEEEQQDTPDLVLPQSPDVRDSSVLKWQPLVKRFEVSQQPALTFSRKLGVLPGGQIDDPLQSDGAPHDPVQFDGAPHDPVPSDGAPHNPVPYRPMAHYKTQYTQMAVHTTQYNPMALHTAQFRPIAHHTTQNSPMAYHTTQNSQMAHHTTQFRPIAHHSNQYPTMAHYDTQYSAMALHRTQYSLMAHHTTQCRPMAHHTIQYPQMAHHTTQDRPAPKWTDSDYRGN